ncbi:Crocetin glucosyltransferase protein [Dioscorea alata]|uniref:Crocetin glucosyltransferase protein n=1 Tax=Dioscorea alata TaxID=55571 RepID=A0ACB7WU68_DIOAL|nr:Crocetin glucosyltransferase protein [Dioscorea alata]
MAAKPQPHFLFITYPFQGHINPALHLAKHLAATTCAAVTFSTTVFAHRSMFSSTPNSDKHFNDGLITYLPFSDGFDEEGYKRGSMDTKEFLSVFRTNTKSSVSILINDLAASGRPVTCLVAVFFPWMVDIASQLGVPSVFYWIQAATVFATYYHFFHGYESLIKEHANEPSFTVCLPGLLPLQIKDLPSFLTITDDDSDSYFGFILELMRDMFEILDREQARMKPRVLINTFQEWEVDAIASVSTEIETVPVGHLTQVVYTNSGAGYLFNENENKYMEWLETKENGSVVYISFGSISFMKKKQIEEMVIALEESKRPYLWVVRKDNREEAGEIGGGEDGNGNRMVVEWCSQVRVLAHKAIGCFVTHCGWNSTLESLACGVPMVCLPQWSDQAMNAKLVDSVWGCGVRSEVDGDGDGVVRGEELVRCLNLVMGDGEKGVEIRRKANLWKDKALEAVSEGGSSDLNLMAFVQKISH